MTHTRRSYSDLRRQVKVPDISHNFTTVQGHCYGKLAAWLGDASGATAPGGVVQGAAKTGDRFK